MGMATQWKTASLPMGGAVRTGLDYNALEPTARSMGFEVPISPETFSYLRAMEAEALNVWSKR